MRWLIIKLKTQNSELAARAVWMDGWNEMDKKEEKQTLHYHINLMEQVLVSREAGALNRGVWLSCHLFFSFLFFWVGGWGSFKEEKKHAYTPHPHHVSSLSHPTVTRGLTCTPNANIYMYISTYTHTQDIICSIRSLTSNVFETWYVWSVLIPAWG